MMLLWVICTNLGCAMNSRPAIGVTQTLPRQVFLVRHAERDWEGEDPPLVAAGEARAQALAAALRDAGVSVDRALIGEGDFRVDSGYRAGLDVLKARPDAVFIANYLMSVGFMQALKQYRLRCPEDVAIVTCDDHAWLDAFSPRLTTVDFPKRELGDAAARLVIERVGKRGGPVRTIRLKSAMQIRESCGCGLRAASAIVATSQ